jgi:co-chaperonin GroES (HSP10)
MITPVWGRLVVKPSDITETDETLKAAKRAGFVLPDNQESERKQQGQIEGELIAVGGNCFDEWSGQVPTVGDIVIYDKWAGFIKAIDGEEYRIISDTDILAIS